MPNASVPPAESGPLIDLDGWVIAVKDQAPGVLTLTMRRSSPDGDAPARYAMTYDVTGRSPATIVRDAIRDLAERMARQRTAPAPLGVSGWSAERIAEMVRAWVMPRTAALRFDHASQILLGMSAAELLAELADGAIDEDDPTVSAVLAHRPAFDVDDVPVETIPIPSRPMQRFSSHDRTDDILAVWPETGGVDFFEILRTEGVYLDVRRIAHFD